MHVLAHSLELKVVEPTPFSTFRLSAGSFRCPHCLRHLSQFGILRAGLCVAQKMFGEQQVLALADYIQAALMLNYNQRRVG